MSNRNCLQDCQWSTLIELLNDKARTQPQKVAYKFLHRGEQEAYSLTYKDVNSQAKAIAAYLQSLDVVGERALLLYQPGVEFITAFFGCLYAGVVAVPAYPPRRNQKMMRLKAVVEDASAKVILSTASLLSQVQSRLADNLDLEPLHWLATDEVEEELANSWQSPKVSSKTIAFLQYTSGSTGMPKGVAIAHNNLLHNERMIKGAFRHTSDTTVVGWLPLFHDMGLIGNVLQPLYLGRTCILMSPADFLTKPIRWLQAISRYRATTSGGPNFAYDLCIRRTTPEQRADLDLSSWQVAFTGAEPVRAETMERFAETFEPYGFRREAFYPCYGMAETTLFVTGGSKNNYPVVKSVDAIALEQNKVKAVQKGNKVRKIVSCGHTWLEQEVAIADPETLTRVDDRCVGEIWVKGESVAKGYWNQPEKTKETFKAYLADTGEGPFLRTGDLGFIQDKELFVTGRLKDLIIVRGQNHYPQDIELTVEKSHPALRAGCGAAFTVEVKNSERLVVVQEVERSYLRKLETPKVVDSIRQAVTAEHSLQPYATVLIKTGSIPKTSSGKVKRYACRLGFIDGSLNVINDWSENPLGKFKFKHLETEVESMLQKVQANQS
jgi:acyl-CoA synthetase (AMP-forming)/AMP-acid ligase II